MIRQALPVAFYRFRATFRRRWGGYVSVLLLIGLIGGIAMASIAAGRLTQSSYPSFLAGTNPSDLTMGAYAPNGGGNPPDMTARIGRLPYVKRVVSVIGPNLAPLAANGAPRLQALAQVGIGGSLDGMFSSEDGITVVEGRLANPNRADEFVVTASAAQLLGVHLGEVVPMGLYTDAQTSSPEFGTPKLAPRLRLGLKLVGIVVLDNGVVQDDIDRTVGFVMLTPALIREAIALSAADRAPVLYGLQLDGGSLHVGAVEQELIRTVPPGFTTQFHVTSRVVAEVELAVKPEAIALGAFGAIAALVSFALALQAISRQLSWGDEDRQVLRALGAGLAAAGDGLIGLLLAVVLGALLAVVVAIALSPLAPVGPVRPVFSRLGITADWAVLGVGLAALVVGLGTSAVLLSYRRAPERLARASAHVAPRGSSLVRSAAAAGAPIAGVIGTRFALEPGRGRTAVPVRSALFGTALAVAMVVATLTFASGLDTLVSHPALYGWNWTYMLSPSNDVPPESLTMLAHDPDVAAFTGVDYTNAEIDDETVPILLSNPRPALSPPILTGHGLDASNEIVLGAATMTVLHKQVGETVTLTYGTPQSLPMYVPPTPLVIVGTATMPAVGYASLVADHTSMGTGHSSPSASSLALFNEPPIGRIRSSMAPTWCSFGWVSVSAPPRGEPTCNASPPTPTRPSQLTQRPTATPWPFSASSAPPRSSTIAASVTPPSSSPAGSPSGRSSPSALRSWPRSAGGGATSPS